MNLDARLALKERLPRAWPAFFERHGNFTPSQLAALPALLDGHNVVLVAPTAGGKTEAAVAPLVERHCLHTSTPTGPGLAILYLAPTRALVNDLAARLEGPLGVLGLRLGVRTGDVRRLGAARPPAVLLTTPESADSLLASQARLFAGLRAVVLDELHLFDGTPRGDHLRLLLNRLRRIRAYAAEHGEAPDASLQFAALSATIDQPAAVAARYFDHAHVLQVGGGRALDVECLSLAREGAGELIAYLRSFGARGWRKALVFCNSRAEVETYAAAVRGYTPFGDAVFVHYSNIEPRRRRETERRFAAAGAALCFASSTLELGIDVGNIDVVILIGPPGSPAAFTQRIGRGNRRGEVIRVACLYRTPLEWLLFDALRQQALDGLAGGQDARPFRPAVAVQQIFSLLKGSPTGTVRVAELAALCAPLLARDDVEAIVGELQARQYLAPRRPGEWGAGIRLNELVDQQGRARTPLSIHSNIQSSETRTIRVLDQYTHEVVATVDPQWLHRDVLTLEGRPITVEWYDGEAMWVTAQGNRDQAERLIYRSERQLLTYELARLLPAQLGLEPGTAPLVSAPDGFWLFHWLGDLYGRALRDLLRYTMHATEAPQPGLCVRLRDEPRALPSWSEAQVARYLHDSYRQLEPLLALGPFHHLLPPHLRRRTVVEQFEVVRFLNALEGLTPITSPEALSEDLAALLQTQSRA